MACSVVSTLGEPFERIARIVFEETARSRERLHQARGALHCDATFVLTGGFQVSGDCPCAEEYLDALCLVLLYLGGLDPAKVHSYGAIARKHCRLRVVPDVQRHRRGRRTQQRVDRLASGAIGRALATDRQRALLVDVVTEAGSAAPLEDDAQLLRSLAERRARRFVAVAAGQALVVPCPMAMCRRNLVPRRSVESSRRRSGARWTCRAG